MTQALHSQLLFQAVLVADAMDLMGIQEIHLRVAQEHFAAS
jgi:hypothetical protein